MNLSRFFFLAVVTVLVACGSEKPVTSHDSDANTSQSSTPPPVNVPAFSGDSALAYTAAQVAFGVRTLRSPGHQRCGDWLVAQLEARGLRVIEQKATANTPLGKQPIRNILAQYKPERPYRILLMAHWDTRPVADEDPNPANHSKPIDGANDGGSGVGALLEMARLLELKDPGIGVDIFLLDAEDLGQAEVNDSYALGSQYWARNPVPTGYKAAFGILLDMVGAKGALFPQEEYSVQYAPDIVDRVWKTAHRLGYGGYFLFHSKYGTLDDHYYINTIAGIPSIDIIQRDPQEGGFFPHWHTLEDTMDKLSPETFKAVGQTVATVVYEVGAEQR